MLERGYFAPITVFLRGAQVLHVQDWNPQDRAEKYALIREMARYARLAGADGVILIFETWVQDRRPPVGANANPRDAMAEALVMVGAEAGGTLFMQHSTIRRAFLRRSRIKQMGEPSPLTGVAPALLFPFLATWDKAGVRPGADALRRDFEPFG